jgi:hypothetical protein
VQRQAVRISQKELGYETVQHGTTAQVNNGLVEDKNDNCQMRTPQLLETNQWALANPGIGSVVVSDWHKAIFVMTPKCGSSTVRHLLGDEEFVLNSTRARAVYWHQLTEEQKTYYKFAFMRDPLSRAISAYGEILGRSIWNNGTFNDDRQWDTRRFNIPSMKTASIKTRFMAFLDEVAAQWNPTWNCHVEWDPTWNCHVDLQVAFHSKDQAGSPYPLEFIGRVEHFDEDFANGVRPYLSNVADIPEHLPRCRPGELKNLINATDEDLKMLAADPDVLAKTHQIYKRDYDLWKQLPLLKRGESSRGQ